MITIVEGDLLEAKEDIICHQVNCQGIMGSGIAKQIKQTHPEVYMIYKQCCEELTADYLLGDVCLAKTKEGKLVANLFGQRYYGTDKRHTDYKALSSCFQELLRRVTNKDYAVYNKSIAIPYGIGCGLGGGDWNIVYGIIEEVFKDYDITIYKLEK